MTVTRPDGLNSATVMTCPRCGSAIRPRVERQRRVVVIHWPDGWVPESETDAPPRGLVLEVVEDIPLEDPLTFVRQFNATSIDDAGSRWAALTGAAAEVGQTVGLLGLSRAMTRSKG